MARATNPLPVALSPEISAVVSVGATLPIILRRPCIATPRPSLQQAAQRDYRPAYTLSKNMAS